MHKGGKAAAREDDLIDHMKSKVGGSAPAVPGNAANHTNRNGFGGHPDYGGESNANLMRALRASEATNEMGYATIQELGRQKETVSRSIETVEGTHNELRGARQTIRAIRMSVYKEWAVKGLVLLALVLLDVFLFYAKFMRKR